MSQSELIKFYEELQSACYTEVNKQFQGLPQFNDKVTAVCYCTDLVIKDLSFLHEKRHFNFDISYMGIRPDPEETIPLGVSLYVEKLPVAYAIGDISLERKAFEIHFIETSNFFGNSGLTGWINPLLTILCSLKCVIEDSTEEKIEKICIVNPVESTIKPLDTMGFKFNPDYVKGKQASILSFEDVSDTTTLND